MINKIGVLTSGGDAPGMNAAIRGVTRYAIQKGLTVEGIIRGYEGLLSHETRPLGRRDVGAIIHRGGTMLRTARCLEFKKKETQKKAVAYLRELEIDALVVIGGDGSMRGAQALSRLGFPTITIPGTIDNDMMGTQEYRKREKEGTLPQMIDPEHKIGRFLGDEYCKMRFKFNH